MPNDMSFDLKSVKCMTECVCVCLHIGRRLAWDLTSRRI